MSLYRITTDKLEPVSRTTFAAESLLERKDLQRLLRRDITPIADDLMVIAEEYGEWEDSNRRIDLLCLSKDGGLVVVEIKRTEDGGHMELQAIRYAAMVSAMTLDQVIQAFARSQGGELDEARAGILEFLQLDSEDEAELSGEVRIILVSADFSTELTTAVLWLNRQYEMGITCVRLRPYRMGADILIDTTQIIPLPESADYEVKIREQEREKQRAARSSNPMLKPFWASLIERAATHTGLLVGHKGSRSSSLCIPTEVTGVRLVLRFVENRAVRVLMQIDLRTDGERRLQWLDDLVSRHDELESVFGGTLEWAGQTSKTERRLRHLLPTIGFPSESDWPELQDRMIDALIRLDSALRKPIQELKI